jgi:pSer/pThr/pTyr-binding forkhead associated (FHA) protein
MQGSDPRTGSPGSAWYLEWEQAGARSRLPLDRPLRIGRDPSSDIRLTEPTISRRHAVVTLVNGQILVDATTSTNGITLERGRANRVTLAPGQSFGIGETVFRVVLGQVAPGVHQPAEFSASPAPRPATAPTRPAGDHALGQRPAPTLVIAAALVAVLVVGAILAVGVFHPGGGPSTSRNSGATTGPLPSEWKSIQYVQPGSPVSGLGSGYMSFRTTDGQLVGLDTSQGANTIGAWAVKTSTADAYAFEAPSGWLCQSSAAGGHDTFVLTQSGSSTNGESPGGPASTSVYWTADRPLPEAGDPTVADLGSMNSPEPGTQVFTVGGLDRQAVASIPWRGGYVVIAADVPDDASTFVFVHILNSWRAE